MSEIKLGPGPEANKEKKEAEPKITVDFFFSAHGTPEDFSHLPQALKNADVFMPELLGWTKENINILNQLSRGEVRLKKALPGLSFVEGLNIPVVPIDLKDDDPLIEDIQKYLDGIENAFTDFIYGDLNGTIKKLKETLLLFASHTNKREAVIAKNLKEELKQLTQKFPQLKNKKNINVLVSLGAAHIPIHQQLKSDLQLPTKLLGRRTIVFGTETEISMKLRKNPDELINDELYARAIIENGIAALISQKIITYDNLKIMWAARKLAKDMSLDKMKAISHNLYNDIYDSGSDKTKFELLDTVLKEFGIIIPNTEEEMDELLNIKKK